MSRERAQRRAAREAVAAKRQEEARRRAARAARWRALRTRFLPRRRRTGRLAGRFSSRRGRAQLAAITAVVAIPLGVAWYFVDAWPERIGAVVLALLALPVIVTLTLDRSTR